MKKFLVPAALVVAIAGMTGCSSYNVSQPSSPLNGNVKTGLKADVAVGEPISGQSEVNILFHFLQFGGDSQFADGVVYGGDAGGSLPFGPDPISAVKSAAAFKAVKSSGADLIVAPRYELTIQDYFVFKKVSAKVTGNKGTIQSIR
ncbi:hypothetical protein thsps21_11270 [Pseudomonas sp. No.21]|jgi:hypothetical protein|uniref:Lipoprotein n=1 Tax=Pseudomonas tohonis TaxID=2725477 RepID=A0A6J4EB29_9PSED|nr:MULTISPECIES: hypothetical protein [Pseudomonas]MDW3712743.1 hypothetical protein [Pseudomonas sp. 2023EL-01195]PZE13440.1 hypothetical protein DMX10_10960 [Pseudomonas sp. 57B-090624]BBP85062.1 hypothetical protein PHLH8_47040 [Pseudomonas sp. Pc102]BCG26618.1 hypothetical protein TUM18999_48090 [Pseudomonas tohonis]GJN45085.1 hypothetical protein TUM20249_10710 [Pseudomonas tohonis]